MRLSIRGCCLNRARTVRLLGYCLFPRSTMPESELPWLVPGLPGLPVYYHRSTGEGASKSCKVQKLGLGTCDKHQTKN